MTLPTSNMSQERILELFEYRDGKLYNKTNRASRARMGMESGTHAPGGYISCYVDGKHRRIHRLIYNMHNGDIPEGLFIDHKNGIKDDNRIENLRVVTKQENAYNRKNVKGYYWHKRSQKWYAKIIRADGKLKYLGSFVKEEDAAQAYQVAKKELHIIEER